tara:strand:- start:64 stop:870 length:807 start_codon:yes stop_codon:yes gene_type:complete
MMVQVRLCGLIGKTSNSQVRDESSNLSTSTIIMKKAIFISARMSSSRLPRKVLLDINGTTAIDILVSNLKKSKYADQIVICTTTSSADDDIEAKATELNVGCFRGSEEDKMERWQGACKKFGVGMFAECGADDVFCDYQLIDAVFKKYEEGYDFIDGKDLYNDVYGITSNFLDKACKEKSCIIETHDLPKFVKNLKASSTKLDVDRKFKKKYRLTLDYEEDLLFFKKILENIGDNPKYEDIMLYLDNNPEIVSINLFLDEEWKENQNK